MTFSFKTAAASMALLAGSMALPSVAMAQSTLTVDLETMFRDSTAAKSGDSQIEAKYGANFKSLQANAQTTAKAFQDQVDAARKVVKADGTLPPANQDALQKAQAAAQQADRQYQGLTQEISTIYQYIRAQISEKMEPIVEKIRKDKKAEIVVPRGSVLAFDPSTDITPSVLQQLNATMTSVSIQLPQAPAPAATAPASTPPKQQPQSR